MYLNRKVFFTHQFVSKAIITSTGTASTAAEAVATAMDLLSSVGLIWMLVMMVVSHTLTCSPVSFSHQLQKQSHKQTLAHQAHSPTKTTERIYSNGFICVSFGLFRTHTHKHTFIASHRRFGVSGRNFICKHMNIYVRYTNGWRYVAHKRVYSRNIYGCFSACEH